MFYFASRIVSLTGAFLYPAYGSYKTLSHRPSSERDLERWLMYWSVLGCIIATEYVAEWIVRWIPFYWEIKTSFLLYLALPQTQGATYIYIHHLEPFLTEHEREIDSAVAKAKAKLYDFIQSKLQALWGHVSSSIIINQATSPSSSVPPAGHGAQLPDSGAASALPSPTLVRPGSSPAQMAWGLWRTYGPSVIAHGTTILTAASTAAAASNLVQGGAQFIEASTTVQTHLQVPTSRSSPDTRRRGVGYSAEPDDDENSLIESRRRLEAELPSSSASSGNQSYPPPPPSSSSSSGSEEVTLVSGGVASSVYCEDENGGRYEKIDREDVSTETSTTSPASPSGGGGGWFGWGASKGYEKLKSD